MCSSSYTLDRQTVGTRSGKRGFFREHKSISVASFNVRSIREDEKRLELSNDFLRLGVDICCVQETKIHGDVDERIGEYRFLNLGGDSHHGLGFFVQYDNNT